MFPFDDQIDDLKVLNQIGATLNQISAVGQQELSAALAQLVTQMGLECGWILLYDPDSGREAFQLAADFQLPPGLDPKASGAWSPGCECQRLFLDGELEQAYTEVTCSRLAEAGDGAHGLKVHASAPLVSGDRKLGILNVAAREASDFTPRSLAMLSNVGLQMGIALERSRLFEVLKKRRSQEQNTLLRFTHDLLGRHKLEDLMHYLVEDTGELLGLDACALALKDKQSGEIHYSAASGWKDDPVEKKRKIPARADSGPAWVMHHQRPLLVEDLQHHDPTSWAPKWILAEGFRGYAVVPLIVDEQSIGVLVLANRRPRLFSEEELRFVEIMANQAALALETARLHHEELALERIEEELSIGRQIQLSLLPKTPPRLPGWDIFFHYQPARQVGGDFYDFYWYPGDEARLGLIVGDVTGKGVPAALFMSMCRTNIRATALSGRNPANALARANELILKDSQINLMLTALCAMLDPAGGLLTFANAGHNRPLLLRAGANEVEELVTRGVILGAFDQIELEERELDLEPGDLILFYTDGVTDAIDENGKFFEEKRLHETLRACAGCSSEEVVKTIMQAIHRFTGETPQADDITLLVLRRLPAQAAGHDDADSAERGY